MFFSSMPAIRPITLNRTVFYALALFTAILESVFATIIGFGGVSPFLYVFGKLAGLLALITWIWIAVLISYNRRPQSTNPLCRSYAHFTSFVVFGVSWLAIFMMLASQTPWECDGATLYCSVARFSTALAFFTSLSSTIAAYLVYVSAAASSAGLAGNVDQDLDTKEKGGF